MTRPDTGDGPRVVSLTPGDRSTRATAAKRGPWLHTVPDGAETGRCWRCGVLFAATTPADLAWCTALAKAAPDDDSPLHYTIREVIEGWAGDGGGALPWLHERAARRGGGPR